MVHKGTKGLALRLVIVLLLLIVAAGFRAAPASADYFENEIVTFDDYIENDCALGGAGEEIHFTGEMHILFFEISNGQDGFVERFTFQPVNLSGVGLTTGTVYRGVGLTQEVFVVAGHVQNYNFTNVYNLVAEGSGESIYWHVTYHVTYDTDSGSVIAVADNEFVECR